MCIVGCKVCVKDIYYDHVSNVKVFIKRVVIIGNRFAYQPIKRLLHIKRSLIMNKKIAKYFTENELRCPCCHNIIISKKLLETLDAIREYLGEPVIIVSGYRCPKHNIAVGSRYINSAHTRGLAADIRVKGMKDTELGKKIKKIYKRVF